MIPDPQIWRRPISGKGEAWYKIGQPSLNQYFIKTCQNDTCGREFLGQRSSRYCSRSCGARGSHPRTTTPSYRVAHKRMGDARLHTCACGQPAANWSYLGGAPDEQADPASGCAYSANPEFYKPECRACHARRDGWGGDKVQAKKTHCPQDHPYDEQNTFWASNGKGAMGRRCRACDRERGRRKAQAKAISCALLGEDGNA